MPTRRPIPELALGLLVILLLTVVLTWPWPLDPGGRLVGPPGGDNWAGIALWSLIADCGTPFEGTVPCAGWPEGVDNLVGVQGASLFSTLAYWGGAETAGSVATHGIVVFTGLLLTGLLGFLLVRRATGSLAGGLVAGVAFESSQHIVSIANAAATYTHAWLTLLPLAAWWLVAERPTRRNALLVGASVIPAGLWSPYPAEHALVVWAACALVVTWRTHRQAPRVAWRWLWSLAPVGLLALTGVALRASYAQDIPERERVDAYVQALNPILLLKPAGVSWLWGDGPERVVTSVMPSAEGIAVYLGVVVIALALVGTQTVIGRRATLPAGHALLGWLAAASVLACLALSQAPTIFGVPTPSWPIAHLVPALRAGQRFVIPIAGGAAILAGLGWVRLAPRRAATCAALTAVLLVAIAVDGYVRPQGYMTRLREPTPALAVLRGQPDDPVLHMPWGVQTTYDAIRPCLVKDYPQPLVNTCRQQALSSVGERIVGRMETDTCGGLRLARDLGVRYLIVDRVDEYGDGGETEDLPAVLDCLDGLAAAGEARRLARDDVRDLWRLDRGVG